MQCNDTAPPSLPLVEVPQLPALDRLLSHEASRLVSARSSSAQVFTGLALYTVTLHSR